MQRSAVNLYLVRCLLYDTTYTKCENVHFHGTKGTNKTPEYSVPKHVNIFHRKNHKPVKS